MTSPGLFVITGFPGTGKLTISRALSGLLEARGETVRVVDNHWINNPIFGLVAADGVTPLPAAVWERVGEVAGAVVGTVEELTPRHWHVIFTAYLDGESDTGYLPRLERAAKTRGAVFVPVRLLCEVAEIQRRIVSPERRELMKSVDPGEPARLAAEGEPYDSGHVDMLTLDVTELPPAASAQLIFDHYSRLAATH